MIQPFLYLKPSGNNFNSQGFVRLYAGWWVFFACAQAYVLYALGLSGLRIIGDVILFTAFVGISCVAAGFVFRYYQPGAGGWLYRILFAVAITAVGCAAYFATVVWLSGGDPAYIDLTRRSMPVRFLFSLLLVAFHIVLMWMLSVEQDVAEVNERKNEAEKLAREAELSSLRQQLNPHFIFNSLNSVSALASDPAATRSMIQQLSDFLRSTLRKSEALSTVGEEISLLQLYLGIEKVRFGHRLNIDLSVADECAVMFVPSLILQPVVENAIKFGLYGTTGEVTITVKVFFSNGLLSLLVKNPYDPRAGRSGGTGFGLTGIKRRMELLYNRSDLLQIRPGDATFETEIRIPQ